MEMTLEPITVEDLLQWKTNNMLTVNAEYQRGAVWTKAQQKRLVDSLFRNYPLPLIYLHHRQRSVAGMHRDDLEIIDGQQRIDALSHFAQGAFKLFDPVKDEKEARFPEFVKKLPCAWAGRDYYTLPEELKQKFLQTELLIAKIETNSDHEARDLFIRLQAGLPLNAQEKRDAWPGGFTEFVLRYGGKPEIPRYFGHEFFNKLMSGRSAARRGKNRQLCAQMAMLLIARRESHGFTDISTRAVDDFYYRHLDFDPSSEIAARFGRILEALVLSLGDRKRRPLKGHEAIHLMLLVDSLLDDYGPSWKDRLAAAFDQFQVHSAKDKKTRRSSNPGEFWTRYDARTRTDSDRGETIRLRHDFFAEKMLEFMGPLQRKDPSRAFGELEREILYHRFAKRCAVCGAEIAWADLEIHHVEQHSAGGATALDNGVPVHAACHPRGRAAVEFAARRNHEPPSHASLPKMDERAQKAIASSAAPAAVTAPTERRPLNVAVRIASIENVIHAARWITSEAAFHDFMQEMRETVPPPSRKSVGALTGRGVTEFQNWLYDENATWRLTDLQLLAVMRTEFPLNQGELFVGDVRAGLRHIGSIRADYNRGGHGRPAPEARGLQPSVSYGRVTPSDD